MPILSPSTSLGTCGFAEGPPTVRFQRELSRTAWEPDLHLSLRGAVRRRSNLLVEEIASPLRGSQ
jgi:hypothetical protein